MTIRQPSGTNLVKVDSNSNVGLFNASGTEFLALITGGGTDTTRASMRTDASNNLIINAKASQTIYLGNDTPNAVDFNGSKAVVNTAGIFTRYNNVATAGLGVPAIYASYTSASLTAAVTNAVNYTPPATAGTYRLSIIVDVSTATTHSFTANLAYKNAAGTAITESCDFILQTLATGTVTKDVAAANGVKRYVANEVFAIDNSATAITLSTVGTFTTVTYRMAAILEQLA